MDCKKRAAALILIACAARLLSSPQEKPKKPAAVETKPLILMGLLAADQGEPAPPLRDIFRPKFTAAPAVRPAASPQAKRDEAPPAVTQPTFTLELTYIGSIRSGGRIVALVQRGGQTVPVAEGEEVVPGYRVVRITADQIEIEGPNAERKTFSR